MNENQVITLLIQLIPSILLLIIGFFINNTINNISLKNQNIKEWKNWWAELFLENTKNYNDTVSIIVTEIHTLIELSSDKIKYWEQQKKEIESDLFKNIQQLKLLKHQLDNNISFSEKYGKYVQEHANNIFKLITEIVEICRNGNGNIEIDKVKILQYKFNKAVMESHAEIINININK